MQDWTGNVIFIQLDLFESQLSIYTFFFFEKSSLDMVIYENIKTKHFLSNKIYYVYSFRVKGEN